MDLVLKCIDNHPQARAHAREIVERLAEMVVQFPSAFANRLDMLRCIESDKDEKRILREEIERRVGEVEEKNGLIERFEVENRDLLRNFEADSEIKGALNEDLARTQAENSELATKLRANEEAMADCISSTNSETRMLRREISRLKDDNDDMAKVIWKYEVEINQLKMRLDSPPRYRPVRGSESRSSVLIEGKEPEMSDHCPVRDSRVSV